MTLDQHASSVRHNPAGHANLVAALRADPALTQAARDWLGRYAEMERAGRLAACWISRTTREILTAAVAASAQQPGDPAGGKGV